MFTKIFLCSCPVAKRQQQLLVVSPIKIEVKTLLKFHHSRIQKFNRLPQKMGLVAAVKANVAGVDFEQRILIYVCHIVGAMIISVNVLVVVIWILVGDLLYRF
jgi:hypothetical protein